MSDEPRAGYHAILKLNLPPEVQYHSGHSLIVQGDTLQEIELILAEKVGEDRAMYIVTAFFENVLLGALKDSLGVTHEAEATVKKTSQTPLERAKALAAQKKKGA